MKTHKLHKHNTLCLKRQKHDPTLKRYSSVYNFEMYRFKVGSFLRHTVVVN